MSESAAAAATGVASPAKSGIARLRRGILLLTVLLSAMVPWYTLHLFPVVRVGSSKVNLLDVLVAAAVCLALPGIVRSLRRRDLASWSVVAFLGGMVIPLLLGLYASDARFFAVREARGLAFYALALAFMAENFATDEYHAIVGAYVVGTVIAAVFVFVHLRWGVPLPGYHDLTLAVPGWKVFPQSVNYLQWTTPVIALMLATVGILAARSAVARAGWLIALVVVAWYILAAGERFVQVLAVLSVSFAVIVPSGKSWKARLKVAAAALLAVALVLGIVAAVDAPVRAWVRYTGLRWSVAFSDGSFVYRVRESRAGLALVTRDPMAGGGLGATLPIPPPAGEAGPWHYVSTGYGFLLIRTGFLGLLLYLAMIVTGLRSGWQQLRTEWTANRWPRHAIGAAGVAILAVTNVLHTAVDIPESVIAFSLFLAMLCSTRTEAGRSHPR